jgi:hypothetical protein
MNKFFCFALLKVVLSYKYYYGSILEGSEVKSIVENGFYK